MQNVLKKRKIVFWTLIAMIITLVFFVSTGWQAGHTIIALIICAIVEPQICVIGSILVRFGVDTVPQDAVVKIGKRTYGLPYFIKRALVKVGVKGSHHSMRKMS